MTISWKRGIRPCNECGLLIEATWIYKVGWTPDPHNAPDGLPCEGMGIEQAEQDHVERQRGAASIRSSQ